MDDVSLLHTEQRNQHTLGIHEWDSLRMIQAMNSEDKTVAIAVEKALPRIAEAIDYIMVRASQGGRIVYMGAGTSGRLGYMDASECPPTYGVAQDRVTCLMAGGRNAVFAAVEKLEDNLELARKDLEAFGLTALDTVVAVSASGRTPYCIGGLDYARSIHAGAVSLSCNLDSVMSTHAEVFIEVDTGAEVIMGSTRMKAGTAQKMVMNMLSTSVMIQLGRTYDNLMVCLKCSNEKISIRNRRLFSEATGCLDQDAINRYLKDAGGRVDVAVVMFQTGANAQQAMIILNKIENFYQAEQAFREITE